jgi:hypothetical protein
LRVGVGEPCHFAWGRKMLRPIVDVQVLHVRREFLDLAIPPNPTPPQIMFLQKRPPRPLFIVPSQLSLSPQSLEPDLLSRGETRLDGTGLGELGSSFPDCLGEGGGPGRILVLVMIIVGDGG